MYEIGRPTNQGFEWDPGAFLSENSLRTTSLVGGQHAVQAPQNGEGENDPSVFGLFEVATKEFSNVPDEREEFPLVHDLSSSLWFPGKKGFGPTWF